MTALYAWIDGRVYLTRKDTQSTLWHMMYAYINICPEIVQLATY